jgi:hypothetical protein
VTSKEQTRPVWHIGLLYQNLHFHIYEIPVLLNILAGIRPRKQVQYNAYHRYRITSSRKGAKEMEVR